MIVVIFCNFVKNGENADYTGFADLGEFLDVKKINFIRKIYILKKNKTWKDYNNYINF